ncbi:MAG: ribosome maturation factor RimM [Thermodesulfobacteriota bacterium]
MSRKGLLAVGRVVGLHGVRGEIKVLPYGDYEDKAWHVVSIASEEGTLSHRVVHGRPHKRVVLLKFADIDTREEASSLVGSEVFIEKDRLEELPDGEYYWFELAGMEVETDEGAHLGRIKQVFSTGGNDVFEVDGPLGEVLIPAIRDVVVKIDRTKKRVIVRLLEGLLP